MGRIDIETKELQNEYLNATDDIRWRLFRAIKVRSSRDKFRQNTFLVITDTLISQPSRRMLASSNVAKQFSVFFSGGFFFGSA